MRISYSCGLLAACLVGAVSSANAQGLILGASGPVNRSMGGAAVATPIDAIGALRWNPATISALSSSEMAFGLDLVFPSVQVSSSITGLAAGTTDADPSVSPVPAVGWVHKIEDSPITIGLGMFGVAGFRSNYPSSTTNPILLPQSNALGVPGGLGRIYSEAQFLDLAPTLSYAVSEQFSIGVSPTVTLGQVIIDPLVVAPPNDADGSGVPRYSSGRGAHVQWGMGIQVGAFYIVNDEWRAGAAIKSPSWMEPFRYQSEDELGNPLVFEKHWHLPMTVSTGFCYSGIESTIIAVDFRYFDYRNSDGLGDSGFLPNGALAGTGFRDVFGLATGIQRQLYDRLYLRAGYTYNQNPIPSNLATVAVVAPLHYQNQFHLGGSLGLAENVSLNLAYSYYLSHSITGPIVTPAGAVPNSSVTSTMDVHIASLGVTVQY